MRLNILISFVGFVLIIAGTYSPVLRPFHLYNIDVYGGNKPYGIVMLLIAVAGILGAVLNQFSTTRFCAWSSLILIIVFYILAWLKVHTSFSFIPFHSLDNYLTGKIRFMWGWYILAAGAILAVAGVLSSNRSKFNSAV